MRTRRGRNGSYTLIIGRENPSIPWQPNFPRGFCHAHAHTHALFFESTSKLESYDDVLSKSSRLDDDASPTVTTRNIYLHRVVFTSHTAAVFNQVIYFYVIIYYIITFALIQLIVHNNRISF